MRFKVTWSSGLEQVVEFEGADTPEAVARRLFGSDFDEEQFNVTIEEVNEDAHQEADSQGTGAGGGGSPAAEGGDREELQEGWAGDAPEELG